MAESPIDPSDQDDEEPGNLLPEIEDKPRLLERLPGGSPGLRTPSPHEPIPGLRVPKEKLKLAAVSMELSDALSVLTEQVHKAEQFLGKQASADRAQITLDHLYLPEVHVGIEAFLETRQDDHGNCKIVVSYYHSESETCFLTTKLDEFPVSTRIELCKSIPELIEAAVAAQSIVASDVLTVVGAIEHALERNHKGSM